MSAFTCATKKIVKHETTIDRTKLLKMFREFRHPIPDDAMIMMTVPIGGD